jgi:hypothetical protein
VYLRKVNVTRFQILGWRQPEENFTYAIEHCEPSYNYSTAQLDQQRLMQRDRAPHYA